MVFDFHLPDKLREFLGRLAREQMPLPFFATAESHNTPRAFSRPFALEYVHYALAMSIMVPGIPFIHSGFELMETKPINTGLGFSDEMIRQHPTETLPLFSEWAFDWTRAHNLVGSVRYALTIRRQYADLLANPDPATVLIGHSDNPHIVPFVRQDAQHTVIAIASTSMGTTERGRAYLPIQQHRLSPLWGTDVPHIGHQSIGIDLSLGNGHVLIFADGEAFPRLEK
jgi:maltooligosyltrehalose synthase